MRIGEILRYPRIKDPQVELIEGYPNFFNVTHCEHNDIRAQMESGINPIADVKMVDETVKPAIIIRSSPDKVGSKETPWQDVFDVDRGRIRYFGDNKSHETSPSTKKGNRTLLKYFELYNSKDKDERRKAPPLLFFKTAGKKGLVSFEGVGVIHKSS